MLFSVCSAAALLCNAQQLSSLHGGTNICKFPANTPLGAFNNRTGTWWRRQAPQCSQLSNGIVLNWGLSGKGADAVITFVVRAQLPANTRFLGIGLSDLGSMKGADLFLFRARGKGAIWTLTDAYARGFETPVVDKQQDITLLGVHHGSNILTAAWQRSVTPCDTQDIPIPATTPLYVIWAYANGFGYHGANRGAKEVFFHQNGDQQTASNIGTHGSWQLDTPAAAIVPTEGGNGAMETAKAQDLQVLDLTFPLEIPNKETNYIVYYFELPSDRKYHIVRYETLVGSKLLHHGVAYSCPDSVAANVTRLPSKGPYDEVETPSLCQQYYMVVVNAFSDPQRGVWVAPADAGLPMGTADRSVIALQLHYNNPQLLKGQKDSGSGLRIYYTSKLRKHDIGMLTLTQFLLDIPPGKASVPATPTTCPGSCTKRLNKEVKLVSGFFHMHGLGKSAIARRFRGGKELPILDQLHSFDYDFHGPRPLVSQVILPGDDLTLQCTFDSTSRTSTTGMGASTQAEMCFYWLMYYPAQDDMGYCSSFGKLSTAICDNALPYELVSFLTTRKSSSSADIVSLALQLSAQGKWTLVAAPNPATTPYAPVCKQKQNNSTGR
jgi:hypothetical protein